MIDSNSEDWLELHGHRLEATAIHEGAVREWRCLDCGLTEADATSFIESKCNDQ